LLHERSIKQCVRSSVDTSNEYRATIFNVNVTINP